MEKLFLLQSIKEAKYNLNEQKRNFIIPNMSSKQVVSYFKKASKNKIVLELSNQGTGTGKVHEQYKDWHSIFSGSSRKCQIK